MKKQIEADVSNMQTEGYSLKQLGCSLQKYQLPKRWRGVLVQRLDGRNDYMQFMVWYWEKKTALKDMKIIDELEYVKGEQRASESWGLI